MSYEKKTIFTILFVLSVTINCLAQMTYKAVSYTHLRNAITLAEAPTQGQDIFHYAPKSAGAEDYEKVCNELLTEIDVYKRQDVRRRICLVTIQKAKNEELVGDKSTHEIFAEYKERVIQRRLIYLSLIHI